MCTSTNNLTVPFHRPQLSLVIEYVVLLCSGLVPLHNACSYGHYEVTEMLVKHGANVNVADLWKFTPLHEAAAKGKYDIVKLLLQVRFRKRWPRIGPAVSLLCSYLTRSLLYR